MQMKMQENIAALADHITTFRGPRYELFVYRMKQSGKDRHVFLKCLKDLIYDGFIDHIMRNGREGAKVTADQIGDILKVVTSGSDAEVAVVSDHLLAQIYARGWEDEPASQEHQG